jgi:mono/diheme cytochrome c family protein
MHRAGWTAVIGGLLFLAGCGGGDAGAATRGDGRGGGGGTARTSSASSGEEAGEGAELYRASCIMCHGENGEGTQLGPALGGAPAEQVAQAVRQGVPDPGDYPVPMPAHGTDVLDEEELQAVSAYAASLGR